MLTRATAIWILGLLTFVPYAAYYLFFEASRDQYALLITAVLFWIFGYWGVVGPILAAMKVRRVMRAIEQAGSREALIEALSSPDAREAAIEMIASENHIPRFLAARVARLIVRTMTAATVARPAP